jgi:hypothetical protein
MSLNLSSTTENVDLIYNGLSDKYETLYPFLRDVNNEGGLTLLTKEEMENKQARILTCCWRNSCINSKVLMLKTATEESVYYSFL